MRSALLVVIVSGIVFTGTGCGPSSEAPGEAVAAAPPSLLAPRRGGAEARGAETRSSDTKPVETLAMAQAKPTEAVQAAVTKTTDPAAPSSGNTAKEKMTALMETLKTRDWAKTQSAAKELRTAAADHKPKDAAIAEEADYQEMQADCMDAIRKACEVKTMPEASAVVAEVQGACMVCHMLYKQDK